MRLEQTCETHPEQYDAWHGKRKVGYLRLRHGRFVVRYGGTLDEVIYSVDTIGDGEFAESEREFHLETAKFLLRARLTKDDKR